MATGIISKLLGTSAVTFLIGKAGVLLRKSDTGALEIRNATNTLWRSVHMALAYIYGDDIILNNGAAGAGDDWRLTISRAATGMTEELQIVLPGPSPTTGQVLSVESIVDGVVTLQWANAAGGDDAMKLDTTSLAFGDASPKAMLATSATTVITDIEVIIDDPFDGAPQLSIGIAGETSKYMTNAEIDLTAAAGTVFHVKPGLPAAGGVENLIATYTDGGATEGAARILVKYAPNPA